MAGLLEWRFGPLRFVLVLVLTIVGGNMFSSLLEEECFFYAGASSGVYGVIGMQFGDALYNWHRTEAPLARILITLVMVAQMAYQIAALDQSVSGMAHLGSFLLGLCGGVTAMMTHIPPTGWQKAAGAVAVLGLATGVVALPMVVYGVGPLGQQAQFAADSFQCCYTAPEGESDNAPVTRLTQQKPQPFARTLASTLGRSTSVSLVQMDGCRVHGPQRSHIRAQTRHEHPAHLMRRWVTRQRGYFGGLPDATTVLRVYRVGVGRVGACVSYVPARRAPTRATHQVRFARQHHLAGHRRHQLRRLRALAALVASVPAYVSHHQMQQWISLHTHPIQLSPAAISAHSIQLLS